jgi:hypothetical protein
MSETATAAKAKTEYTAVKMTDGREVQFPGKRQIQKEVTVSEDGNVSVRFDFRNGSTLTLASSELDNSTVLQSIGHGLSQKCGDEAAGSKDIDDIVAAVDDMMSRLRRGEWRTPAAPGDSFAGASIVVKAVAEASGKTVEEIKAFLQKKLDTAKAEGKALTRQDLYASFRKPGTATAAIIQRLEAEKASKAGGPSAEDLLAEIA